MAKIHFKDLEKIRERHKNEKIVFSSGCFDLTHAGHALFFEDCRKYGDVHVVMIGADDVIKRDKGEARPILNEHLRLKMVDSLKAVDYAFLDFILENAPHPLHIMNDVFMKLQPDVYVINKDAFDIPYREKLAKKYGFELVILERWCPPEFERVSTSTIIEKVKKLER